MNLAAMKPHPELVSTGYCLANSAATGGEYLVYLPEEKKVVVDLSATQEKIAAEWFNPDSGMINSGIYTFGGGRRAFISPFKGDAVLYLKAIQNITSKA
jgi:hypothetical protein